MSINHTFSFCIKRDGEVLVGAEIGTDGSVEENTKAEKAIQRLLNEYTPNAEMRTPELLEKDDTADSSTKKATQTAPEHPKGSRGLLQIRCPDCNNVFGTFLREYQTEVTCKCGQRIDLTAPTARFAYTCPYCEQTRWGRTNLEDPEITVRCKCGGDIDLQWNPKTREYQN